MPDHRSVMKEFRTLDEKRSAGGLTPTEELRYAELRDLVAPELGTGGAPRGFDVDAAAARLRESLLPAGLRNRPPPTPAAAPEPAPVVAEVSSTADAMSSAFEAQPFAPLDASAQPEGFFDPASLDSDAAAAPWDPNAQACYDPAQPYDPNAQTYYAPAQPYDPNAQTYYDPAQPYDPNAQTYYDPAQPYDPNAPPHDPSQPWDPSAAACEASPPHDAGALEEAAPPQEELGAEPHGARSGEPGSVELEASPAGDPAPIEVDATTAEIELAATPALELDAPGLGPVEPSHPAALDAGELAGPGDPGEEVFPESAWEVAAGALDADPVSDAAAHDAVPSPDLEVGAWDEVDAPSVDATAEQLAEGELAPLAAGEYLSDEEPGAPAFTSDASPLPPAGWEVEPPRPEPVSAAAFGDYDDESRGSRPPPGEDAGLESMLPLEPAAPAPAPEDVREGFGAELGEYDDTAGFAAPHSHPAPPDLASETSGFQAARAVEPAERGGWDPDVAADAPPLDDGFRLESGGSFDAPAPAPAWDAAGDGAALPWESAAGEPPVAAAAAPEPPAFDADEFSVDLDDVSSGDVAAPAEISLAEEDLPTIDGEDILEEIVEDVLEEVPAERAVHVPEALDLPGPAVAAGRLEPADVEPPLEATGSEPLDLTLEPEPRPEESAAARVAESRIAGVHRVVVHTVEGQVRRGVLEDADLEAPTLALVLQPGVAPEWIETGTVKAIFFMLAAGERPPAPDGKRVRVTFGDGRQVAGFSPDYREDRPGFFMIPADTRTNTGRIWVYRAAARQVTVS